MGSKTRIYSGLLVARVLVSLPQGSGKVIRLLTLVPKAFPQLSSYLSAKKQLLKHIRSSAYTFPKIIFKTALNRVKSNAETYDEGTEIVAVGRLIPEYGEGVVVVGFTTSNTPMTTQYLLSNLQRIRCHQDTSRNTLLNRHHYKSSTSIKD